MHIAICDDSLIDRQLFVELLEMFLKKTSINYEVYQYSTGTVLIDDIQDGKWFDIVFLDIYMDNILGINVAKKLRNIKYNGKIVFTTSTSEFALEGYDVQATGYILKPYSIEKIVNVLKHITNGITINSYKVQKYSNIINIPYNEILFIESNNSKCILHRSDKSSYVIYKRLDTIEAELNDNRFLRCHQSYLVNMNYIQRVDKNFTLTTGDTILIRQRSLKSIKQMYLKYNKQELSIT